MNRAQVGRVPWMEKIILGFGMLSSFFGYVAVNSLAFPVYNMILGVSPALIGVALLIPRLWDAFTDPLMGVISDNFHSRWGRRKPFIVIGSIFMGVSFGLLWMAPTEWSETLKIAYFIVFQIFFFTFFTIFYVPYTALTYEMTPDYNERTRVMSVTAFFKNERVGNARSEFNNFCRFPYRESRVEFRRNSTDGMVNWSGGTNCFRDSSRFVCT